MFEYIFKFVNSLSTPCLFCNGLLCHTIELPKPLWIGFPFRSKINTEQNFLVNNWNTSQFFARKEYRMVIVCSSFSLCVCTGVVH